MWRVVAKRAVLASGAFERPIAFGGNDRPGVMMASAVRTYLNRFGVAPGRNVVVFTSSDDGWLTVRDLGLAGVTVAAVVDARAAGGAAAEGGRPARQCPRVRERQGPRHEGRQDPLLRDRRRRRRRAARDRGRLPRRLRRLQPQPRHHHPSRRPAPLVGRGPRLRAVEPAGAHRGGRRGRRPLQPRDGAEGRRRGGRHGGRRHGLFRRGHGDARRRRRPRLGVAALARRRLDAEGLRRLPARRDGVRRRHRPARGLPLGRAPEALHDARHGDGPGQDLGRQRARHHGRAHRPADGGGRHDGRAAALHPGRHRAPSPATTAARTSTPPATPPRTAGPKGWARPSSRRGCGCAPSGT